MALVPPGKTLLKRRPTDEARLLEQIVENIPHMVFVKDADDLRYIRFNRAAEALLGFDRGEMLGLRDHDLLPGDEADYFVSIDRRVLDEGCMLKIAAEFVETRHLGTRVLHTKKIPIYGEDGSARYLLGISEDITEHYESEMELSAAREEAELLNRERGAIVEMLQRVIAQRDIDIVFQPIVAIGSNCLVGAEALSRFGLQPVRSPDHWFNLAAEVGLQVELEIAALQQALLHLKEFPALAFISVNLSPATLVSPQLAAAMEHYQGDRLVLEAHRAQQDRRLQRGGAAHRRDPPSRDATGRGRRGRRVVEHAAHRSHQARDDQARHRSDPRDRHESDPQGTRRRHCRLRRRDRLDGGR